MIMGIAPTPPTEVAAKHFREHLAPAVHYDKRRLSKRSQEQLTALVRRRPGPFFFQLALAWMVISTTIWTAVALRSTWATVIAIIIIATRQNVLGLLVHEQAHCLAMKARPGDLITNLLAGYPLLVLTVESYAQVHLLHHRFYFTTADPDFLRKSGKDWESPMEAKHLARLFVTDLLAGCGKTLFSSMCQFTGDQRIWSEC